MVVGAIVYTLAELIGGPVLSATAAEAAPDHLRGRYLSMTQLAWNLSSTITPVGFAWLLDRGPEPIWFVMLAVAGAFALVSWRLGAVLPQAAERVTNHAAEPEVAAHLRRPPPGWPGPASVASVGPATLERSKGVNACASESSPGAATAPGSTPSSGPSSARASRCTTASSSATATAGRARSRG